MYCQFIEPVTFARCAFIFAFRNILLGGYLWRAVCVKTNFYRATNSLKRPTLFEQRIHRSDEFLSNDYFIKAINSFERRFIEATNFLRMKNSSKRRILFE